VTDLPPRAQVWRVGYSQACRMRDAIMVHQLALSRDEILARRFVAIRLDDGTSDGVCYDTRHDAMMAQRNHPAGHMYWQIGFELPSARVCDLMLWYAREAYRNGVREDPRMGTELYVPTRTEEIEAIVHGKRKKRRR
jgi:hypothetical protein